MRGFSSSQDGRGGRLPTARVEYALRGDDLLSEADVRELMQVYIAHRARRMVENGNGTRPYANGNGNGHGGSAHDLPSGVTGGDCELVPHEVILPLDKPQQK